MATALEDVPGITVGFQYPVQMRFNELMTGARQDVVLKIFGDDLDSLMESAKKIGKIINEVEGTQNLYIEPISGLSQVVVKFNRPVIAQYHLSIAEINRVINAAFAGQNSGQFFEGEKRFDIVVRLNQDLRQNLRQFHRAGSRLGGSRGLHHSHRLVRNLRPVHYRSPIPLSTSMPDTITPATILEFWFSNAAADPAHA